MFGNLKNKLGEVTDLKKFSAPNILNSLTGSRQQSVGQSPGSDTPVRLNHSRQLSNASQNGMLSVPSLSTASLQNLNEKELLKEISKLKDVMERLQSDFQDALTMKEQSWLARVQEEQRKASSIERQLINLRENEKLLYQQLKEKENVNSTNSVSAAYYEAKLKETEKQREILQEDYDQLEGLGTQEIAKLKHLLLDTSTQLENANQQLDIKTAKLEKLNQELENVNETARKYSVLVEEKMEVDTTVAGLRQKLNNAKLKIVTNEKEKEDEIQHLEQKIAVLENRNKQDSLEVDDRIKALIHEREALDHLLEEKRQELSNIKLSWSEKICNLENKIQNLGEKIAEDQDEIKNLEETNESLTKDARELKSDIESGKENYSKLDECDKAQIARLEENMETMLWQNGEDIKAMDNEITELKTNAHKKEDELAQLQETLDGKESKIAEMEELYNESFNELEDAKTKLSTFEDEYKILKSSQEAFASSHSAEKENCQKLELELSTVRSKCETAIGEKQKLSANLDELMEQVASLEADLVSASQEAASLKENCSAVELSRDEYQTKYEESNRLMIEAELNFEQKVTQSDLVKSLEDKCKVLEDELADTKQKFKVQKQRMEDMKKTVQKELRIIPDNVYPMSEVNNFNRDRIPTMNESGRDLAVTASRSINFPTYSPFSSNDFESINVSYLKHVLLKFMTSRESEAIQLVRAIGELLHMTKEEEQLLSETMTWKMSWFGPKPNLGKGQNAKVIPSSQ